MYVVGGDRHMYALLPRKERGTFAPSLMQKCLSIELLGRYCIPKRAKLSTNLELSKDATSVSSSMRSRVLLPIQGGPCVVSGLF